MEGLALCYAIINRVFAAVRDNSRAKLALPWRISVEIIFNKFLSTISMTVMTVIVMRVIVIVGHESKLICVPLNIISFKANHSIQNV